MPESTKETVPLKVLQLANETSRRWEADARRYRETLQTVAAWKGSITTMRQFVREALAPVAEREEG